MRRLRSMRSDLVAVSRSHLDEPELLRGGVDRGAERVSVPERPGVRPGARLFGEGMVVRDRAVGVDAHDPSEVGARVLRWLESLPLAGRDEQLPIGREDQTAAEMAQAECLRNLSPDHGHVAHCVSHEFGARHGGALQHVVLLVEGRSKTWIRGLAGGPGLLLGCLGVGEIERGVLYEVWIDLDVQQAALVMVDDLGHAGDRRRQLPAGVDAKPPGLFGDQQPLIGQERHAPRNSASSFAEAVPGKDEKARDLVATKPRTGPSQR